MAQYRDKVCKVGARINDYHAASANSSNSLLLDTHEEDFLYCNNSF